MSETARRTIVTGGTVVAPGATVATDVLIEDGMVVGIERFDPDRCPDWSAAEVVDASGAYVLPGGVDVHTHLDAVFRGSIRTADDFASGTAAAVAGGTTTVVDFCAAEPGERLDVALARWRERVAAQRPWADYGAHVVLVQPDDDVLEQLRDLPGLGVSSIKMYMAYPGRMMSDDRAILRAMQRAAEAGILVLVHAENGHAIDVLVDDALAAGHVEPEWHGRTRPPLTEAEAVSRAAALARLAGAALYVVHVSSADALAEIGRARAAGAAVHAETCSHYLVLDESMLEDHPREASAPLVCSPPARSAADRAALWDALADARLDVLSSDHCPFALHGEKIVDGDFTHIMNGLPGIEQRMLVAYQGVAEGRYPIERMVDAVSTRPAALAGIGRSKGAIRIGADADLVILDPRGRTVFSVATHHSAADYLPYEGMEVAGAIRHVLVRGRTVFTDGVVVPDTRFGSFLARGLPEDSNGEKP
ncbi:dihydropyrimidinase [Microbacterium sp. NPDC090218]